MLKVRARKQPLCLLTCIVSLLIGGRAGVAAAPGVETPPGYTPHFWPVGQGMVSGGEARVFTTFRLPGEGGDGGSVSSGVTFEGTVDLAECASLCKVQSSCRGIVYWRTTSDSNRTIIPHCTGVSSLGLPPGAPQTRQSTWSFGITVRPNKILPSSLSQTTVSASW